MKFSTDHYFQIGHAHYTAGKPCQDHALSKSGGLVACAIVSDGCSTGGNTDAGARILTFGTLQAIRDHARASDGSLGTAAISITARQQQLIGTVRPMLGLDRGDMLATCAYAYLTQHGGIVHVQGDGVVGIKFWNGCIEMHRFDWAKNAPFYPSYGVEDAQQYIQGLHKGIADTALMSHVTFSRNVDGSFGQEIIRQLPFNEGREGVVLKLSREDLAAVDYIAVFTDGVSQIGKIPNGDEAVDWRDAVVEFLAFKTSTGEFAKRRMIRGVRDLHQIGKGPIDDISYAVIHVEKDTKEESVP
jgi:hypothetical protein